jgi:hypothetical protein
VTVCTAIAPAGSAAAAPFDQTPCRLRPGTTGRSAACRHAPGPRSARGRRPAWL